MAASLVGGALLSSAINVLLERLTPELIDSINLIVGKTLDAKLLPRLKTSLEAAKVVLNDAELKQFNDRVVKDWLDELRDAVYELEDLVDEIVTGVAAQKRCSPWLLLSCVIQTWQISGTETLSWRPPVTSRVEASEVYGREKEKEDIIKLLFNGEGPQLSVIPIVGMGGVGKTTLVNSVYNDEDVKREFDFSVWVCVSEVFDLLKIAQTIIKSISPDFNCDNIDLNLLQLHLVEELKGKRFLAVLDDVWSDKYTDWDALKNLFHNGVEGCKILVTTRLERVALIVKTISSFYYLDILSDKDCLSIFAAHAFHLKDSTTDSCLEKIGRDVANKCKGLPLAAKSDITLEEVGYRFIDDLTSRYFFQPIPKKVHFDSWDCKTTFEYFVMHDLIHELATHVARDFYFRLGESEDKIGNKTRHLSCNFRNYPFLDHDVFQKLKGVRTFIGLEFSYIPKSIGNAFHIMSSHLKYLRTLSLPNQPTLKIVPESIGKFIHLRYLNLCGSSITCLPISICKLYNLQIMDLCGCTFLKSLPSDMQDLVNLRYLNLSHSKIVNLPNSVCKLYNLQTLKLRYCDYLEMLPSDMQDLVNLRHLDISGTCLKEMPRGLGNLKDLQFLSDFIVGKEQETGIGELGGISHLKGWIHIGKLENVKSGNEAYNLTPCPWAAPSLKELYIWGLESVVSIGDEFLKGNSCDSMTPFPSLEILEFSDMTSWEQWHSTDMKAFPKLRQLIISNCKKCGKVDFVMSSTTALQNPKSISIEECNFVKSDDMEGLQHLNSLQQLKIMRCFKLEKMLGEKLPASFKSFTFGSVCCLKKNTTTRMNNYLAKYPTSHTSVWITRHEMQLSISINKKDSKGFANLNLH
ncbi:hypothetical protein K1719_046306 [Acacia pycnantha]|nr:hypothetical protein K1719_046306 [Acacia pycnantha]